MAASPYLVEISWEVCNKVGGIHTVITSKVSHSLAAFPDRYLAVGPLLPTGSRPEFKEQPLPAFLEPVTATLQQEGVSFLYGKWLLSEEPPVLLIGWEGLIPNLNQHKESLWKQFQLDTLGSDFYDLDQPLLWGIAVGKFLRALAATQETVIAHCHEWLSAGALLETAANTPKNLRTVFTTHATVLGRSLMNQNRDIYAELATINAEQAARSANVLAKFQLEKLAAAQATIFTAVSQITAREATAFLGRTPEVITENGIGAKTFPSFDILSISRLSMRQRLLDFLAAYFFPSYRFDLSATRLQFTMGRYEPHNKGYDLYLSALATLNADLKASKSTQTLVSFFLVPANPTGLRPEVATQLTVYQRIVATLDSLTAGQQQSAYGQVLSGSLEELKERLLPEQRRTAIDHVLDRLPRTAPTPSPFTLKNEDQDYLLRYMAEQGLTNAETDPVKVIFLPVYLDGFDGLFNIPLYELLTGFDLGVFPSYYEPWGYTPLESLAVGVPAVTSDLSGFGQAASRLQPEADGLVTMKRSRGTFTEHTHDLADILKASLSLSNRALVEERINAYRTAYRFSWDSLFSAYRRTYTLALKSKD